MQTITTVRHIGPPMRRVGQHRRAGAAARHAQPALADAQQELVGQCAWLGGTTVGVEPAGITRAGVGQG